jgi:hypothetical protein
MGNANEFDAEGAHLDHVARLYAMEQCITEQIMLFKFALSQPSSKMGTIDGNVKLLKDIGQGAQMVFVTVGENYRADVVSILFEKVEIRDANIYTVGRLFGKSHTGVKDQHLILVTHSHAIHPKLTDTAEGNNLQDTTHFSFYLLSGRALWPGFLLAVTGRNQALQYSTRCRQYLGQIKNSFQHQAPLILTTPRPG